jgi:LysR family nitrogen assimilation transcriptional regulator
MMEADVDLKQLTAIIAVAENGSVTRAAELLHTVQPALTRQIKHLERELGTPLFERTRHGMQPTAAGLTFVDYARRAMAELECARNEIQPDPEDLSGTVTVGLLSSTADLIAGSLVASTRQQHPGVLLRLTAGYAGDVTTWLEVGSVDVGLVYQIQPNAALEIRPLVEEALWAVAPAAAGLDPAQPVSFAEVARHDLVMPSEYHGLRRLVNAASTAAGVELRIVAETNAVSIQRRLVMSGLGWTVLPGVAIRDDLGAGLISAAPLTDAQLTRRIALAIPRRPSVSRSVRAVAGILVEEMDLAVRDGRWPSGRWLPS